MKTVDKNNVPVWGCPTAHFFERSGDPFHADTAPDEFKEQFNQGARHGGWMAIDWCGNQIGFCADGAIVDETVTPEENLKTALEMEEHFKVKLIIHENMGVKNS